VQSVPSCCGSEAAWLLVGRPKCRVLLRGPRAGLR
jgi:hypothetical protein